MSSSNHHTRIHHRAILVPILIRIYYFIQTKIVAEPPFQLCTKKIKENRKTGTHQNVKHFWRWDERAKYAGDETVFVNSTELHSGLHLVAGMRDMARGDPFIIVASHIYARRYIYTLVSGVWIMDHMTAAESKKDQKKPNNNREAVKKIQRPTELVVSALAQYAHIIYVVVYIVEYWRTWSPREAIIVEPVWFSRSGFGVIYDVPRNRSIIVLAVQTKELRRPDRPQPAAERFSVFLIVDGTQRDRANRGLTVMFL